MTSENIRIMTSENIRIMTSETKILNSSGPHREKNKKKMIYIFNENSFLFALCIIFKKKKKNLYINF
jgi:hypothetical protein